MAHDHGNMNMDDEMSDMCPMDMSVSFKDLFYYCANVFNLINYL